MDLVNTHATQNTKQTAKHHLVSLAVWLISFESETLLNEFHAYHVCPCLPHHFPVKNDGARAAARMFKAMALQ